MKRPASSQLADKHISAAAAALADKLSKQTRLTPKDEAVKLCSSIAKVIIKLKGNVMSTKDSSFTKMIKSQCRARIVELKNAKKQLNELTEEDDCNDTTITDACDNAKVFIHGNMDVSTVQGTPPKGKKENLHQEKQERYKKKSRRPQNC